MNIVINADSASFPEGCQPLFGYLDVYLNVLISLGYPQAAPPFADLLRQLHGLTGRWLIVSPIHWQATHNDVLMCAAGSALSLEDRDGRQWFEALATYLAAENMTLYYHNAYTWLLRCDNYPPIVAVPVQALMNQSLSTHIQTLDDTLFWVRLMTETQLLFSAHPLNHSRVGLDPINGVWFWGAGELDLPIKSALIYYDPEYASVISLLSTEGRCYSSTQRIESDAILVVNQLDPDRMSHLQHQVQNHAVHWYWNNMAYISKPMHWLSRSLSGIRRLFKHDH